MAFFVTHQEQPGSSPSLKFTLRSFIRSSATKNRCPQDLKVLRFRWQSTMLKLRRPGGTGRKVKQPGSVRRTCKCCGIKAQGF